MPIYKYKCRNCKTQFEKEVSSSTKDQIVNCKSCNSPNTGKSLSLSSYKVNKGSAIPSGALSGCSTQSGFS